MRKYYALHFFLIVVLSAYAKTAPLKNDWFKAPTEAVENHSQETYAHFEDINASPLANYISFYSMPPNLACPANITQATDSAVCTADITTADLTPSFDVSTTTLTWEMSGAVVDSSPLTGLNVVPDYTFPVGTTTIEYTASDGINPDEVCSFTVTISDSENPVPDAANLSDITAECSVTSLTTPTAIDNCAGSISGSHNATLPITTQGTTTVTWTYDDGNGNTVTQNQDVVITDTTAPIPDVVTLPTITGQCSATISTTPTATDACEGAITGTTSDALTYNTQGTHTVVWTYDDGNGNTVTQNQDVIITDTTAPVPDVATLPTITEECSATISTTPTATDACAGSLIGTTSDALSYNTQGTHTVVWTYDDGNGNTITQNQTVVVQDTTNPTAICQDISIQLDPNTGTANITAAQIDNGSSDNCGNVSLSLSQTAFGCADLGDNTVTLTVDDGNGNTSSCTATVTITEIAYNPSVLISASSTTICNGDSVTFTTTPTDGGSNPAYQWYINGIPQGGETGSSFTTSTLANSDSVTVTMVSDISACATAVTSNAINMTVNPIRNVSFNINASTTTICSGESISFNHGPITNGGASPDFEWFVNGGSVATTETFSTSTLSNGDVVTLEVTSYVSCASPTPATSNNSITITVNPLPTLSTSDGSVCASNQTSIDLNSLVTTNGTTVTFHTSQGNADNDTGAIASTVGPNATTTYYVRSEFATGCYVTDTIEITVNPLPTVEAGSNQEICIGESFDLSTIASGSGTLSYHTSQTDANTGANTILPTVSPSATSTYYVRSLDSTTGCYNTDSVTITVHPLPTLSTIDGSVCASNQTSIDLNSLVTTNGTVITFHSNQTDADNDTGAISATVSPTITTTYYVRSESAAGCFSTDIITITIDALPTLSTSDGEVCASGQTSINLNSLVTTDGTTVIFHTNQTNADNDTGAISASVSPLSNTTYYVRSENNAGCYSTDTITITVNPLPNVVANASASTICIGDSVTLTGSGASSYSWDNGVTDGVTFSPASTQTYTVTGYDANGCFNTDSITITVNPNATLSLNGSNNTQDICVGSSISNIIYTVGGGATGATVTGLPTGLNGSYSAGTFTISGTATASGTYNYTVTTQGCGSASATGTIRVFSGIPSQPTAITGDQALCPPVSGLVYSVPNDPNVLTYVWSVPIGFNIVSGQGTNQITVNSAANASGGNVSVSASNPCGSSFSTNLAILVGNYAYANAGPDQVVCEGTTQVTLAGTIGGVINNHNEWDWDDNGAGGTLDNDRSLTSIYYLPGSASAGDVITITIETVDPRGSCSAVSDTMTITVIANPTASISGNTTICEGSTANITFNATPNSTVTYNINGGGNQTISIDGSGTAVLTTGALSSSTTYNLVSVQYNSSPNCSSPASGSALITVNPIATVDAGANQTICEGSTATLAGSFGGGASSATWSSPTGGSFNNPNNTNAIYTPSAADISNGSVVLTYTTDDPAGPCNAISDTVTITINPEATVDAGTNQTICEGSTVTLAGSFGGGASSATWSSPTGGSFNNPNNTNAVYTLSATDISNGSVVLTYTTNDPAGPCNAISDTVTITINSSATVDAGANQTICEGITVTLAGSFGGGASSATWSSPTGGSFNNPNNTNAIYTPSATDISNGSVVLTYTTDDPAGPCNAISDTVTITINPEATVDAGTNQTICEGSTVTLAGSFGGGASSATWSSPTGGSFNNPNNTNAVYTLSATDISNGSVVLTYTTNDPAGPCNAVSDIVTITINPEATVNAGADQTICSNTTATMNATLGGSATSGTWSTSGSGSFNNNSATAIYTPSAGDISNGSVTLTYTTNNPAGPCNAVSDSIVLTLKEEIIITTQPENVGVCVTNPASLSVVAYGDDLTYQWYYGSAPGTPVSNGGTISGATTATLNFSQTYLSDAGTYYVVISGDASCSPVTSDEITLNVNQIMNITSQPVSQTLCEGTTATFNVAATGSISGYQWYKENGATDITLANGGDISGVTTNQLQITNIDPSDAGQYYVIITGPGGTCPSATSALATLNVTQIPTANISYSGNPYCESVSGAQSVTISGTHAYTGGTYTASPSGLTINSSTGAITPSSSTAGTYTVTYTISASGGCGVEIATTSVTITAVPTASISYPNPSYCETDSSLVAVTLSGTNAYSGGTYSVSPSGLTLNASNGNVNPSTSSVGTYTITYTVPGSGGCPAEVATSTLSITPLPVATFNYSNSSYCASNSDPSPVFTGGGTAGNFSATPSGLSINASTGVIDLSASTPGTYTVTNTHPASNGCITVTDSATITIDAVVTGGNVTGTAIGPDGTLTTSSVVLVCQQTDGTLELSGYTGSIVQWESSTDNGTNWTIINNTNDTITYSNITTNTLFRVLVDSGACGQMYSSIAVVTVVPDDLKPTPVTVSDYTLCLGESSVFTAQSQLANGQYDTGGLFNTGQLNTNDPNGWLVDGSPGGWTANGNNSNPPHDWSGTNNHYNNNSCTGIIDSDDKKFAIADGITTTVLETPIFNTFGLDSPTFEFDYAWYLPDNLDQFLIEVSVDGGVTYEAIPLLNITGPAFSGNYNPFTANHMVIDFSTYPGVNLIGINDIRIRLTYVGNTSCSGVYLDNIELPAPPADEVLIWSDAGGNIISYDENITVTPPTPGVHTYVVSAYLVNSCGYEITTDNSEFIDITVYDSDTADAGPDISIPASECGTNMVTLNAAELTAVTPVPDPNDPNNTINLVSTGTWTVTSGQLASTYSFSDVNDHNSTFTGVPGETYTLQWLVAGPTGSPCPDSIDSMTVTLPACATLDFDGIDDNVTFRNHYDFNSAFTIELWVKSEATTGSIQTIFSKRNGTNIIGNGGYDLRLVNNVLSFRWNGSVLTASNPIATDRWYHTAVTFDGGTYRLYVDGILVGTAAGSAPTNNNYEFLLGAMDQAAAGGNPNPINYFNGWMDEMRIWNVALSDRQVRHMMNQEIQNNGGNVRGAIVPIDIPGLSWNNLTAYYRMNQPGDVVGGYLIPTGGSGAFDGQLRNITTWQEETAPLPYLTRSNGDWNDTSATTPWLYGDTVWDYPNSTGINGDPIDWNIVRLSHNVTSQTQDVTVLGLLVDATREMTVTASGTQDETNSGHGLWVTHYLDLDGQIDLIGESQLVQKRYTPSQVNESILDANSAGYLERDQQGTTNLYNYNYWSSPVSAINPTTNNTPYTISNVLRDGTNSANPLNIGWVGGHDASGATNPIGNSRRWIYAYYNAQANNYSEWDYLAETGTLATGLGFTMKGSGVGDPINDKQNYVFTGKPHNNTISNLVSTNNSILVGNPYPSAIDSQTFINENGPSGTNSITGTLYFWDHYHSSNTHVLANYEGGYAQLNLIGGNAAVTPPATVDGYIIIGGTGTRIPGRYVPVSQGFFVSGSGSGGQVTFTNNQRVFQRETTSNNYNGSQFFRMNNADSESNANEDTIKRIRFDFTSQANSIRHLLLGFTPNNEATDGVDYGYDAPNFDNFPSDLSFDIESAKYVIQGVGQYDETKTYPLILEMSEAGNIEIKVIELENFDEAINVYLYDNLLGTYTLINNDSSYQPYLEAGVYNNRFYITFTENSTLDVVIKEHAKIQVNYLHQSSEIYINVPEDTAVKQVYLINILGQTVKAWNYTNHPFSSEFRLPVTNIAQGNYIVKVETDTNYSVSKKIVVK